MYRVFALNGMVGAGFSDDAAFETVLNGPKLNLIANDCGSMDGGPSYLGSGVGEYPDDLVYRDLTYLVRLAQAHACPLVLGSCGYSGDTPHLRTSQRTMAQVLADLGVTDVKVAAIDAHVESSALAACAHLLKPLGNFPQPTPDVILRSRCVGQMGTSPVITALDAGANIVMAGRACDVSVFAAAMIRDGIDPGLAHHVGHIMECGGIALDPASGAECIVAEIDDQGNAAFLSPDPQRHSTVASVAGHSFYEESHPALQDYPEGVLSLERTRYLQVSEHVAAINGSTFVSREPSLKIEGSLSTGRQVFSLIPCDSGLALDGDCFVYGKNGVEARALMPGEQEMGFVATTHGPDEAAVEAIHSVLLVGIKHAEYPNRTTTSGNAAIPQSPLVLSRRHPDGTHERLTVWGSREPRYITGFDSIMSAIIDRARLVAPEAFAACEIEVRKYDAENPLAYLAHTGPDLESAKARQTELIESLGSQLHCDQPDAVLTLDGGDAYEWSVFHILDDPQRHLPGLFPVELYNWNGSEWEPVETLAAKPVRFGLPDAGTLNLDPATLFATPPRSGSSGPPRSHRPLTEMAKVIRSKDAGAGMLSYDVFFNTRADFDEAMESGVFTLDSLAERLDVKRSEWLCSAGVPECLGVKMSRVRPIPSGSPGCRDVYGSQQQMPIESIQVPIFD